eukprot:scaffold280671_cov36-Attheya_sp.AAC.1
MRRVGRNRMRVRRIMWRMRWKASLMPLRKLLRQLMAGENVSNVVAHLNTIPLLIPSATPAVPAVGPRSLPYPCIPTVS